MFKSDLFLKDSRRPLKYELELSSSWRASAMTVVVSVARGDTACSNQNSVYADTGLHGNLSTARRCVHIASCRAVCEASRYLAYTARVSVNIRGFLASESESLTDSRSMQSKRSTCLPAVLRQLLDIAIIGGN